MKLFIKLVTFVSIMFALAGCLPKQRYEWSEYDKKLYSHYKDPAQKEEFVLALKETLDDAESDGRVPPGIFAEYGFVMYEQGNSLEAVKYYQKEADRWPEARPFMTKMIINAQKRSKIQEYKLKQDAVPVVDSKHSMAVPVEVSK